MKNAAKTDGIGWNAESRNRAHPVNVIQAHGKTGV